MKLKEERDHYNWRANSRPLAIALFPILFKHLLFIYYLLSPDSADIFPGSVTWSREFLEPIPENLGNLRNFGNDYL